MSELTQVVFDYAALPADAALTARAAAERIKLRLKRTVEDIIEIGRELMEVKEELPHGQFLPWIAAEFEMSEDTATNFMKVCSRFGQIPKFSEFKPSVLYLLAAPKTPEAVIEKAVAKAESGEKVTVADVKDWKALEAELEIERQARLQAEEDKSIWMQRNKEWQEQNKLDCSTIDALKRSLDAAKNQPTPKPVIVEKEVLPDDYEDTKKTAAKLKKDIDSLKKKQDELVNQRVESKIKEHENELVKVNRQVKDAEEKLESLQKHINSYSSIEHMTRLQRSQIERVRTVLVELAASMEGFSPLENDAETKRWWTLLADMLRNGAIAVDNFVNNEM